MTIPGWELITANPKGSDYSRKAQQLEGERVAIIDQAEARYEQSDYGTDTLLTDEEYSEIEAIDREIEFLNEKRGEEIERDPFEDYCDCNGEPLPECLVCAECK